jgi:hypothetical protein
MTSFEHQLPARRARGRKWVLTALCLVLLLIAAQRLTSGFHELIWKPSGAWDLMLRYRDVNFWFAGRSLAAKPDAVYPPASLALLWPFLGWESWPAARWLWALTTAAILAWLGYFAAREVRPPGRLEWAAVFLLPSAVYAARAVIVNGQLTIHLLPPLIGGVILLDRAPAGWKRDLGAAGLLLLGLVKPTVALPFVLFVLAARRPLRPAVLVASGYAGLTVFASWFQRDSLPVLLRQWYERASLDAATASAQAHANVHSWLRALGLEGFNLPVSLALLAALGAALYAFRRSDVWLRLGMAAIVARMWGFHYRYDDYLLVIPLIALARVAVREKPRSGTKDAALALMALVGLSLMIPARLLMLGRPWSTIVETGQTLVWLAALAYLSVRAWRDRRAAEPAGPLTSSAAP